MELCSQSLNLNTWIYSVKFRVIDAICLYIGEYLNPNLSTIHIHATHLFHFKLPELDNLPSPASFIPSMTAPSRNEKQSHMNGPDVLHEANLNAECIRSGTPATVIDVDDQYSRQEQQHQFTG